MASLTNCEIGGAGAFFQRAEKETEEEELEYLKVGGGAETHESKRIRGWCAALESGYHFLETSDQGKTCSTIQRGEERWLIGGGEGSTEDR